MTSSMQPQTRPSRQQALLRYAATCRQELAKRGIEASRYDWERLARPNQLPPPGDWRGWLLCRAEAGRWESVKRPLHKLDRLIPELHRPCALQPMRYKPP